MPARPHLAALALLLAAAACKPAPPAQAAYTDLQYADGTFLLDGQPFTGHALQYHPNGQLKADWEMVEGLNHGVSKEFDEAGQQVSETSFVAGKHHGDNRYWDAGGNLIKHQVYDMDEEVSVEYFGSLAGEGS